MMNKFKRLMLKKKLKKDRRNLVLEVMELDRKIKILEDLEKKDKD